MQAISEYLALISNGFCNTSGVVITSFLSGMCPGANGLGESMKVVW
jgi:hypothetical protein